VRYIIYDSRSKFRMICRKVFLRVKFLARISAFKQYSTMAPIKFNYPVARRDEIKECFFGKEVTKAK
jgi:hypothetical protein